MARIKGLKNGITKSKVKELGIKVNVDGISYDKTGKRVVAFVGQDMKAYVSLAKAGDEKTMFFAAAGIRNYMRRHKTKPSKDQISNIILNAKKAVTGNKKQLTISTQTKKVVQPSTRTKDRSLKAFSKVIDTSLSKGVITKQSAVSRIMKDHNKAIELFKQLKLDIDHRFMTYVPKNKHHSGHIMVRITTNKGLQREYIYRKDFNTDQEMIAAADKIRRHILTFGKVPTENKKALLYAQAVNTTGKILRSSSSEALRSKLSKATIKTSKVSSTRIRQKHFQESKDDSRIVIPDTAPAEQIDKLKEPNFISKIKAWIFG